MSSRRSRLVHRGRRPTRIYLHIGTMKTGTTYLQDLMSANKDALAAAGFLFPGERWSDQSGAVRDVMGFQPVDPRNAEEASGSWDRMSQQMLAHDGSASIISMEFLSFAGAEQATRVVESLHGAEVHVVLTVRDAAASIPAQWQTSCRNGGKIPLRRFVQGVGQLLGVEDDPPGRAARTFQRTQDVVRMLDVWVPLVGRDHVHVVTVPPRGSDPRLLWRRFAGTVGVDPAVCADAPVDTNRSLGLASTELLRRLNAELGDVPHFDYVRTVKGPLARVILGSRASLESRVSLNQRGRRFAARWNERVRAGIERHGVELVGTFDDLPVAPPGPEVPKALPTPTEQELLEAAATAFDGLQSWSEQLRRALDPGALADGSVAAAVRVPDLDLSGSREPTSPDRWAAEPEPAQAAVRELAVVVRACMELRDQVGPLEHADTSPASAAGHS